MKVMSAALDAGTEQPRRYATAGWLTFVAVFLWILSDMFMLFDLFVDLPAIIYDPVHVTLAVSHAICWVYAIVWFRRLLNERFDFHDADTLITLNIVALILIQAYSIFMVFTVTLAEWGDWSDGETLVALIPTLLPLAVFTFLAGVVGVFYGIRLLGLSDPLFGLKSPLAYTYIVGSLLTLTLFLAPLGVLLVLIAEVFQGMILLRGAKSEPVVDFV